MEDQELDFDTWFDIFASCLVKKGYKGAIYKETFEQDYDEGKSPENSAEEYYNEYCI